MKWHMRLQIVEKNVTLVYITFFRRVEEQHCGSAKSSFQFNDDNKGITEVMHTTFGLEMRDKHAYELWAKCFENQQHFKQERVANL